MYKIDFAGFCSVITELVNNGPECYKRLLFASLSLQNQGRICEHDIFSMIENFKQRENFFFYKELITTEPVPRDFKDVVDFSDKIFFEAYSSDIKKISRALNLRKHLLGIEDQDCATTFSDDLDPASYASKEQLEETLANHIDYMIGLIFKKSGTLYQAEVVEILIAGRSMEDIRQRLYVILVENRLLHRKEPKKASTFNVADDLKK